MASRQRLLVLKSSVGVDTVRWYRNSVEKLPLADDFAPADGDQQQVVSRGEVGRNGGRRNSLGSCSIWFRVAFENLPRDLCRHDGAPSTEVRLTLAA